MVKTPTLNSHLKKTHLSLRCLTRLQLFDIKKATRFLRQLLYYFFELSVFFVKRNVLQRLALLPDQKSKKLSAFAPQRLFLTLFAAFDKMKKGRPKLDALALTMNSELFKPWEKLIFVSWCLLQQTF